MRLIDADTLLQKQYRIDDSATLSTRDVVDVEDIEDAPTVCDIDAIRAEILSLPYNMIHTTRVLDIIDKHTAESEEESERD